MFVSELLSRTSWTEPSSVFQGQPPPEGDPSQKDGEQTEDRKQKENSAYAKKMVLRLAGLMGVGGAASLVYIFGEWGVHTDGPGSGRVLDLKPSGCACL